MIGGRAKVDLTKRSAKAGWSSAGYAGQGGRFAPRALVERKPARLTFRLAQNASRYS
jgi:hypothetical protein